MEQIIKKIMAMPHEKRVALAHGLLMELEKSGDITCWNFWERDTVREIAEERVDKLTSFDMEGLMGRLNREWDNQSQQDWSDFTDKVGVHLKAMRLK